MEQTGIRASTTGCPGEDQQIVRYITGFLASTLSLAEVRLRCASKLPGNKTSRQLGITSVQVSYLLQLHYNSFFF